MLVEVRGPKARVALPRKRLRLLLAVHRNPLARRLAEPPVQQASLALLIVPVAPASKRPLAHPNQFGCLLLVSSADSQTTQNAQKHRSTRTPERASVQRIHIVC